jgi:hypothetical protein
MAQSADMTGTSVIQMSSTNVSISVTVSPSPQSKDEENEKLHKLREYARDFWRCYGRSTVVSDLDGWGFILNV